MKYTDYPVNTKTITYLNKHCIVTIV